MLADEFLPDPDVTIVRSIPVDASAETTYDAIPEARLHEDPLLEAIGWLRTLPERLLDLFESTPTPESESEDETIGRLIARVGAKPLAEEAPRERVYGLAGRFWDPRDPDLRGLDAEAFEAFEEPGYARGLLDLNVHERGEDRCLLVLELRAAGIDHDARQALTRFAGLVRPAASLVAHRALQVVKASAETGTGQTLPEPSRAEVAAAAGQLPTIDDLEVEDRRVVVQADLSDPGLPSEGRAAGRLPSVAGTIGTLLDRRAGVIVLAHGIDPTDEESDGQRQAEALREALDRDVAVLEDVDLLAQAVGKVEPGDVLVVALPPWNDDGDPKRAQPRIESLVDHVDAYVNDAFAVSHREDPAVVAFSRRHPSAAGPSLMREISALDRIEHQDPPRTALLGGTDVEMSLDAIGHLLATDSLDEVLVGGLVGAAFLEADGHDTGEGTRSTLEDHGALQEMRRVRDLLDSYRDELHLPQDVVVQRGGEPLDIPVEDLPAQGRVRDLGPDTVNAFSDRITDSACVFVHGPVGIVEEAAYAPGTHALLERTSRLEDAYTVVTGHSTRDALEARGLEPSRFDHVSRAGQASMHYLAGNRLPGLTGFHPGPS